MNPPTLTLGATVVTLPMPSTTPTPQRTLDERRVSRRTIGGRLRTTVLSYSYVYRFGFTSATWPDHEALHDLWQTAITTGTWPRFAFPDLWPSADGVEVAVDLGPVTHALPAGDLIAFDVTLEEVNPR